MGFLWGSTPEQDQMSIALGSSLLGGQNVQQQFAGVAPAMVPFMAKQAENKQAEAVKQSTLQMLQAQDSDLAQAVQANAMTPAEAVKMSFERKMKAQQPRRPNIMSVGNGMLYDMDKREYITPPEGLKPSQVDAGYTIQYGVDGEGNVVPMQPTKDGRLIRSQMPEGVKLSKEPIKLDAGTHYVLIDPITRQPISTIQKDIAGAELQKELGTAEGKNIASAPGDLQAGLNAKDLITSLKTDPNREWGTGLSGWLTNSIPSSPGYDYQTKVDQAKSGAFATAIQQMRGLGSLSNAEGETATKAVTRMNTATSEEAFLEALDDYEKIIDQGIERAKAKLNGNKKAPNGDPIRIGPNGEGYDQVPSGAQYVAPDGSVRVKK